MKKSSKKNRGTKRNRKNIRPARVAWCLAIAVGESKTTALVAGVDAGPDMIDNLLHYVCAKHREAADVHLLEFDTEAEADAALEAFDRWMMEQEGASRMPVPLAMVS